MIRAVPRVGGVLPPPTLAIEAGIAAGSGLTVRGALPMRGAARLSDALNHWTEPLIPLRQAMPAAQGRGDTVTVIERQALLWVRPLEAEARQVDPAVWVEKDPRPVLLYAGPFEVRGTAYTFRGARWMDFREGLQGQFFPLVDARIAWAGGAVDAPLVVVNAACVAALIGGEERRE